MYILNKKVSLTIKGMVNFITWEDKTTTFRWKTLLRKLGSLASKGWERILRSELVPT